MTLLEKLIEKRRLAIEAARTILTTAETEERAPTDEERVAWKAHLDVAESTLAEIKQAQEDETRQVAAEAALAVTTALPPKPAPGVTAAVHVKPEGPYSLLRAMRASASHSWSEAKFEKRASDELSEQRGQGPREDWGFHVPYRALLPVEVELRDLGKVAPTTEGAGLVGVDLMPEAFIELLRAEAKVVLAGAQILPNLIGDVKISRQITGGAAAWVTAEGQDAAESNLTTDAVTLAPKTVGLRQDVTRTMVKQTSPGVENLVREDTRLQIGNVIDVGALNGSGSSGQPTGIINASPGGVTTTGTLTWPLICEFESDVGAANALRGKLAWMTRSAVKGECKTTVKESGQASYLMEQDGTMNGYPSFITENVPAQHLIFGNWAEILIGMWGSLDMFADPYTLGDQGALVVRGFQDVDIGIRHALSFSVATDV